MIAQLNKDGKTKSLLDFMSNDLVSITHCLDKAVCLNHPMVMSICFYGDVYMSLSRCLYVSMVMFMFPW